MNQLETISRCDNAHAPSFCLCPCPPCSSVPAHTVVRPRRCGGRHAHTRAVCPCPYPPLFIYACARCCPSPFVRARLRLFAGPRLSLAVCVHSVVLDPDTWLCLFGFRSCSRARWCSLGFVCAR